MPCYKLPQDHLGRKQKNKFTHTQIYYIYDVHHYGLLERRIENVIRKKIQKDG